MQYTYYPKGVCSQRIDIEITDGMIKSVKFSGGCHGNTQGVSRLVEGYEVSEVIRRLEGINCMGKGTSCPDQLAGLVFCEHCHSLYIPTTGSSKARGKIHYYGCGARRRNGKSVCSTHLIPAELLEKFVLYRMREILTSSMYKEQFEMQLTRELEILQSKKKDITKLKKDIAKITTQKNKLLDLMLAEENEELVKTYKEKLEDVIAQLSINNDQLKLYETIDISAEERELRKQFNKSHEDITYKDFQELSREQLKVFFNYMIDHIDIRELENIGNDPRVYLAITIHLKLNGYAPKYSIEYLKNINTGEKQKASHSKNDLLNGGGEGLSPITATNENEVFPPEIQPIHKIFSYIVFPIKRENLKLFRL